MSNYSELAKGMDHLDKILGSNTQASNESPRPKSFKIPKVKKAPPKPEEDDPLAAILGNCPQLVKY